MPVRSCRVTIQDMDGVSHTVEVTAATLYEAVAQGLAAIRGNESSANSCDLRHAAFTIESASAPALAGPSGKAKRFV